MAEWQPSASLEVLRLKARILQQIRAFFLQRQVLEVETPVMSHAGTTDPNIHSFSCTDISQDVKYFLQTSPEFAMKRLLAAGSGSIYQVARVFRRGESGRRHNPEFTLLEWYRTGIDHFQLMEEVDRLVHEILGPHLDLGPTQHLSYAAAFETIVGLDPFSASLDEIRSAVQHHGIDVTGLDGMQREPWLDLLMSHVVEPGLDKNCSVFIYDFPASQAALAKIKPTIPAVAERFELFINGMELANGFHELTDAGEQRRRFETEMAVRRELGMAEIPMDEHLLQALQAGLPDCAGVALGLDRLLMLAAHKSSIADVLAFDFPRA